MIGRGLVLAATALLLAACGRQPTAGTPASAPPPTAGMTAEVAGDAERGQALFRNKGCIGCHVNRRVPGPPSAPLSADGPPDLTDYRGDPAFLRRWLADPAAVRPDARMPRLGLSEQEIAALIAFLNQPR